MPSKTAYSRKRKYKAHEYHGERGVGGNLVYAGENVLDKHLFVHRAAPGGFDWGPDADEARACQLAIALLAPVKDVDVAIKTHHLFAGNVIMRDLTDDSWTLTRTEIRDSENRTQIDGWTYPENTAPGPDDVPALEAVDLEEITYAEELALASKYDDVLWPHGNRRENLQRLRDIWAGDVDPADDAVSHSPLYHLVGDIPSNARRTLVKEFDTMGELAQWVCFGRNHTGMSGISAATAEKLREALPAFVRYFGGKDYLPDGDGEVVTVADGIDTSQQTLPASQQTLGEDDE